MGCKGCLQVGHFYIFICKQQDQNDANNYCEAIEVTSESGVEELWDIKHKLYSWILDQLQ